MNVLRGNAPMGGTTNVRTFAKEELKNNQHVQAGVTSENYIQLGLILRQFINWQIQNMKLCVYILAVILDVSGTWFLPL